MEDDDLKPMDFGNIDAVMMMLNYSASQLINKEWSIHRQAVAIAEFQAKFMNIRMTHEADHTATPSGVCPFCSALKLSLSLNREI